MQAKRQMKQIYPNGRPPLSAMPGSAASIDSSEKPRRTSVRAVFSPPPSACASAFARSSSDSSEASATSIVSPATP
jgi:hypothetical protein